MYILNRKVWEVKWHFLAYRKQARFYDSSTEFEVENQIQNINQEGIGYIGPKMSGILVSLFVSGKRWWF